MINLYDILDAADGQLFGEPAAQIFSGFSFDHRTIRKGELFVALKTERGDGHHYMEDAMRAGAGGLMCTHPPTFDTDEITVIIMRDVDSALMRWSRYVLEKYETTVIAVTGSYGKSTTINAICNVLSKQFTVYDGKNDFSGRYSVPLALSHLNAEHQIAVLEFAPEFAGEMSDIIAAAPATVAVVTNIEGASEDAVYNNPLFAETHDLVESLPDDGIAIVNFDNPALRHLASQMHMPIFSISVDQEGVSYGADLTAYNIIVGLGKTGFDLRYGVQRHVAKWVPLLGAHNLYPILAAIAVGLSFEMNLNDILTALHEIKALPGRMSPLQGKNGSLIIDDSYSSTEASLRAALDFLQAVRPKPSIRETQVGQISPRGKISLVLGEVDQLGGRSGADLKSIGRQIVDVAHLLVTEGDAAAHLSKAALDQGLSLTKIHVTYSPQDSALAVSGELGDKDLVFVKGNAEAHMERVVVELLNDPDDAQSLVRQQLHDTGWGGEAYNHTRIFVNVDVIGQNVSHIKRLVGDECKLMAVVKANAYGHGLVPVSTTALLNGADYLGVANLDEALRLRDAGLTAPILILNYTPSHLAQTIIQQDVAITLADLGVARGFNRLASGTGRQIRCHVRVDMGTLGLGVSPDELAGFFRSMARLDSLSVEGIYTALDDRDFERATNQLGGFLESVKLLRASGLQFEYVHAANTTHMLSLPEGRLNMVRCGRALYGLSPKDRTLPDHYRPALTWVSSVSQVKRVSIDTDEGEQARTIAVIPVGYGDGFRAFPKHWGEVLLKGQRLPLLRPPDQYESLIDISAIDDVRVGDEVVLIGTQGEQHIHAEDVARQVGSDATELMSGISQSIQRYTS